MGGGMALVVQTGDSFPLGATVRDGGVNFCLFARGATAVENNQISWFAWDAIATQKEFLRFIKGLIAFI